MMTSSSNNSTAASARPREAKPSNRQATSRRGVAIAQSSGLPSASHHARIVRTSRALGLVPPMGCVCMKPTTSPRASSRASVQRPSAHT